MFCKNCGNELDERWMACPKCGADVAEPQAEETNSDETQNLNEEVQYDNEMGNEVKIARKPGRVLKLLILVVIVCFFCPMYMVSCGNQEVATLSGIDLTFGFTVATEEIEGNWIFGLLVLLPILAFVAILKNNSLDRTTEEGREEIKQRFYICGAAMMSAMLFELYFFSTIQSNLEESMILYEAMGSCHIMRIAALISVGLATYQAHLFEPWEKDGRVLSKKQKILRSIKNVVIIALILTGLIIAIYSKIMASFEI